MSSSMWAIKMVDSMGKIGSGVLEGNIQWLGSYDECLRTEVSTGAPFDGKYCKGYFALPPSLTAVFYGYTPSFGICMPKSCSNSDTTNAVNSLLQITSLSIGATCQEEKKLDTGAIVAMSICGFFIALIIIATSYDVIFIEPKRIKYKTYKTTEKENVNKEQVHGQSTNANINDGYVKDEAELGEEVKNEIDKLDDVITNSAKYKENVQPNETTENSVAQSESSPPAKREQFRTGLAASLLLAFSAFTNAKKLLNTRQAGGTLGAINGIRFISMTWVILGHAFAFVIPSINNALHAYTEFLNRWTFMAISNALLSVDTFFTLSGLLLAYVFMKEMDRERGRINWFMFYFHRFWRLTPPYMLVMMINITMSKYFGDGPNYPEKGFELEQCTDVWWRNLLYIQNFFDVSQMCFGWSWYLANDMQFYVISPLILVPLYFWRKIGKLVFAVFLLGMTVAAVTVSAVEKLPVTSISERSNDYMAYYYAKPYCRMGPYLIGIITGYMLYTTKCKVKINKYVNLFIWLIAFVVACIMLYGVYNETSGTPMNTPEAALYNGTSRTIWGACVCWVVFACSTGYGGFVNKFLSWEAFIPLGRLTYCAYLVHPIVIFTYTATLREFIPGNDITFVTIYLAALAFSYAVAFVTSLAFEAPMMGLEKAIFKRK